MSIEKLLAQQEERRTNCASMCVYWQVVLRRRSKLRNFRSLEETKWSWFIANGTPAKRKITTHVGLFEI